MSDRINVTFTCSSCGPTEIRVDDETKDSSPVFCATCGADFQTTWGEVKAHATEQAKEALLKPLLSGLKKSGWKISKR